MVEITKEELEKLNDEQEMLEFFERYHKSEVDMSKMKILHALHDLKDGIGAIYKKLTKGMTKERIKEWQEQCEYEDDDGEWAAAFDNLVGEIEQKHKYKLDIEVDEYSVTISYYTKFFWIRYDGMLSGKKPKMSEMEKDFEVELSEDAHFLIDLITNLIYEHKEE